MGLGTTTFWMALLSSQEVMREDLKKILKEIHRLKTKSIFGKPELNKNNE